ncbi:MAG: hypothetical protein IPH88_16220 [Bacteroidales bacterium]|nr:hypothetical protein [Bacteroidales bacterium]
MRILFIFLISFLSISLFAQSKFGKYSWSTFPINGKPDTVKCINGASIMLERRILEVVTNQEDQFEEVVVFHKKLKLDSHAAIDNYNKIYIPINNVIDIISIKARFFSPSGRITELKQESIRQIDNLDNKGDYKTFAVEGAEVGGQLEYFYILKRKFNPYSTVYIQDEVPRSNVMTMFVYPSKLEYIAKSYNGFPAFTMEQKDDEITYLKASIDYIPAISKELYSNYKANMMRYEYTLSYNHYNSSMRIYSWSKACKNLYDNTFDIDKKEKSAVESLLKKINPPASPAEARIRGIENWVKSQIAISEEITYSQTLNEVIKNKQCSKPNAIRLFVALFREAAVPFELAIAGNNEDQPFDPDFNGFNYLQTQLLYFPQADKYMVPDDPAYRLGPLPENVQGFVCTVHPPYQTK